MTKGKPVIAIDIGGTKIAGAIVNARGRLKRLTFLPTHRRNGKAILEDIVELVQTLKASFPKNATPPLLGIAAPGPIENGSIVVHPPNMPGWKRVDLKRILARRTGLRTIVENDANAAALAEYRFGAGRRAKVFLYITVSTGIGGGIVLNGQIFKGSAGGAGEIGHTQVVTDGPRCGCGQVGCLEAVASGTAMARTARQSPNLKWSLIWRRAGKSSSRITAETIHAAARRGDTLAKNILRGAAEHLGIGIANAIQLLNPDVVVVGGGVSHMGELLLGPARKVAKNRSLPILAKEVRIVRSKLGKTAGVLGAAAICFP